MKRADAKCDRTLGLVGSLSNQVSTKPNCLNLCLDNLYIVTYCNSLYIRVKTFYLIAISFQVLCKT